MAFVTADRIADTTTTVGTSPLVVSGVAPLGSRTFSAVMSVGDTCYYSAQHRTLNEWEVGLATYSSADTLTRTTVYSSSNAGSSVTFSAGTKDVFITMAAARSLQLDASGNVTPSFGGGTYTRTTFTATAGQTSFTASYTVGYVQVYLNGILLNSADYTATTGTTVVLAAAAAAGDIVDVIALNIGTFTSGGYTRTTYTGTAGQTSFTASYTPGYIQVYLNGVLLDPTDYTATSGTAIVLGTGTAAGDTVDIVALNIGGFTGGVTVTGTPASGQIAAWTGSTSIQGIAAPTTAGNTIFTTDGTNWSSTQKIVRGTSVTLTTQTSVDFTGIPSWAKRITVMFAGMSGSGTSSFLVQLGTGSIVTSGYVGANGRGAVFAYFSAGFILVNGPTASQLYSGTETFTLLNNNNWTGAGVICANSSDGYYVNSGYVPLGATLTTVRITTVNGTDTLDAGNINILYE